MVSEQRKRPIHYAWVIVWCGSCFFGTALGVLGYTVGNFFLPVSQSLGCGVGAVSFFVTLNTLAIAAAIPFARKLVEQNLRKALLAGATIVCLSLVGLSQCRELWQFYVGSVALGIGSSFFAGVTVPTLINRWFHRKNGTALGICLASAALIGAIMNPILAQIILRFSWQVGYGFLAVVSALLLFPPILFGVRDCPQSMGLLPYGYEGETSRPVRTGMEASAAIHSPAFPALLVLAPCVGAIFYLTSHLPTYAQLHGMAEGAGAFLTSASLVGAMLGKLTLGMLGDRLGPRAPLFLSQGCVILGVSLMLGAPHSLPALLGGSLIFGYGACTTALLPAILTQAAFGERDYDKLLSYITMSGNLLGGFGNSIYGALYDLSHAYTLPMLLCIGLSLLVLVCGQLALRSRPEACTSAPA